MGILLIACIGENIDPVITGIREFPVGKLILVSKKEHEEICHEIISRASFLKIDVETKIVGEDLIKELLKVVSQIVNDAAQEYDDIYINVGGGDRQMSCAAISAAFVNGLKAFDVMNDMIIPMPVLKFSYCDVVSEAKFEILRTLKNNGGVIDSLNRLSENSGVEKSLLSYHIRGGRDSKGLKDLGLVEVDRKERGKLKIRLTTMGEMMLIGR